MSSRRAEAGVCIVRVEAQPDHLLITVTTNRSVGRHLHSATSDPERHFAGPEDALRAVADFLRSFT